MKITLPFLYTVSHRPKGSDRLSTTTGTSTVEAEVPELARSDVASAARWNIGPANLEVLSWNGDLYQVANHYLDPVVNLHAFRQSDYPLATSEHLASASRIFGSQEWWSRDGLTLRRALGGSGKILNLHRKSDVVASTEGLERAAAQRTADGLLFVCGVLWHRIPGLMLGLTESLDANRPNLHLSPSPHGFAKANILSGIVGEQNPTVTRYFSLDCLEAAARHTNEVKPEFDILEILLPEASSYDGESEFAIRVMNTALRTNGYRAGSMGDHEIGLWLHMRDTVESWYDDPTAGMKDGAVEALFEFVGLRETPDPAGWLSSGCEIIELYRAGSPSPRPNNLDLRPD